MKPRRDVIRVPDNTLLLLREGLGEGAMSRHGRAGFSLAEMMIALAVLGMGLLIIGAALPLGVRYTRESINLAKGEAAGEHALDTIGRMVRLRPYAYVDTPDDPLATRYVYDGVYRQWGGPDEDGDGIVEYGEGRAAASIVQVWPLVMNNIEFSGGDDPVELPDDSAFVGALDWLDGWYTELGLVPDDVCGYVDDPVMMPAVSALERVYPPVNGEVPHGVDEFYDNPYPQPVPLQPGEQRKVVEDSMIGWTALYRRVSPATSARGQRLYEFIAVTTRRPGPAYGFAVQDDTSAFAQPQAALGDSVLLKRAAPVPWLVCFEALPYDGLPPDDVGGKGPLTFGCSPEVGKLLPEGSVFFPAVISGMDATHVGVSFGGAGEKKLQSFQVYVDGAPVVNDAFDRNWAPLPLCAYPVAGYDYWCYEIDPTRGLVWKLDGREVGALSGGWGSWKDASKTWGIFESAPVTQPGGVPASQTEIGHATPGIGPALVKLPVFDPPVNTLSVTVDVDLSVGQSVSLGFFDEGIGLDLLSNVGRAWARVTRRTELEVEVEFFRGPGESCPVIDPPATVSAVTTLTVGFDFVAFVAYVEVGRGGIIIIRREFLWASQQPPSRLVPRVTGALPVFKVIERPDESTVIVENNGFAPWTVDLEPFGALWPVWVIPPAYKDAADGQPVFDDRSPVLSVTRRYLNLRSVD